MEIVELQDVRNDRSESVKNASEYLSVRSQSKTPAPQAAQTSCWPLRPRDRSHSRETEWLSACWSVPWSEPASAAVGPVTQR